MGNYRRNSAVAIYGHWPSCYSLKLCDGLTGPRTVLRILFFFAGSRGGHKIIEWNLNVFNFYMVAIKILMLKKNKNHPKRATGKFIPSISHIYSTVDPSCAVIAKILQWLYGRGFCENSRVRGHIGPLYLESLFFSGRR